MVTKTVIESVIPGWPPKPTKAKRQRNARYNSRLRDARLKGAHTAQDWSEILERHGHKCASCGVHSSELIGGRLTKDHIVSLMDGGSDAASNLQPLCRGCNTAKRFAK